MEWQANADGSVTCAHGTYGALETCQQCTGFVPSAEVQPANAQAVADEAWCRTQRDKLVALADTMTEQREDREAKDRVGYSTVAKLFEVALKFHRAAMEERIKRDDVDYANKLEQAADKMLARRKAH